MNSQALSDKFRRGIAPTYFPEVLLDAKHGTMWGGSSNHGEDYGIAW